MTQKDQSDVEPKLPLYGNRLWGYKRRGPSLVSNFLDSLSTTSKSFPRLYQGGEIYFSKEEACFSGVCLSLNVPITCLYLTL